MYKYIWEVVPDLVAHPHADKPKYEDSWGGGGQRCKNSKNFQIVWMFAFRVFRYGWTRNWRNFLILTTENYPTSCILKDSKIRIPWIREAFSRSTLRANDFPPRKNHRQPVSGENSNFISFCLNVPTPESGTEKRFQCSVIYFSHRNSFMCQLPQRSEAKLKPGNL